MEPTLTEQSTPRPAVRPAVRRATPTDAAALVAFNARIFDDPRVGAAVRDLLAGHNPLVRAEDFYVVTDAQGDVLSSADVIVQTWRFEDVPFTVGQIETVGTDPAHRRQGLSRALIERCHHDFEARRVQVSAILGIPYLYRRFGYEYALDAGGARFLPAMVVPIGWGHYHLRRAVEADAPALAALYARAYARYGVVALPDEAHWRYQLGGRSADSVLASWLFIVEDADGQAVGYARTSAGADRGRLVVTEVALPLAQHASRAIEDVARALADVGRGAANGDGFEGVRFELGREHPVYTALNARLEPLHSPYAWYLRVPNLPAFVQHVAPALEARLALLPDTRHYTGTLRLSFYDDGLTLAFEQGRLARVAAGVPADPDAAFPPGTFLKLLFGYRALHELRYAYPDCWAGGQASWLLGLLFPRRPAFIMTME